jgi:dTDP-4-dehydrorhamnose reductase
VRVLVTGAGGQLGREIVERLERRGAVMRRRGLLEIVAMDHQALDVADREAVLAACVGVEPDVVIHPAAWTAVDACEEDPARAFRVNALGTRHVAEGARLVGAHVCYVSTDYVFDGEAGRPYHEWDEPRPLSVYGRSKLGGERELDEGATVVRSAWICGRYGSNMVKTILALLGRDAPLRFVDDQRGSPTVAGDLAERVVELALARRPGVYHVTNGGDASWYELARAVVEAAGGDPDRVEPIPTAALDPPRRAVRPRDSRLANLALGASGFGELRAWQEAFEELVHDLRTSR